MQDLNISIADLRRLLNILLLHLEESDIDSILLPNDYYWDINEEHKYNVNEDPKDLQIGQISDNLSDLFLLLDGTREPLAYDLVLLASILRMIGESISI